MAKSLKLTRNQLSSFLNGNHELIKQFETLFTVVDTIAPDFINDVLIAAGIADTKAQQSLDAIERVSAVLELAALAPAVESAVKTLSLVDLATERDIAIKNQEVLTWLSM